MTTLCWGTVAAATTAEALAAAAAAGGFDAISVTPAMGAALVDGELPVPITSVDALLGALPGSPALDAIDPAYRHFFEPGIDGCVRALERTGARVLNVAHFLGRPTPLAELVDGFGAIGDRFARIGVRLTLEFIPGTGIADLPTALAIVGSSGVAEAGVLVDTWHLDRSGGTLDDVRAAPPGTLRALQLSDRRPPPPGRPYVPMGDRLLPGDGDLPLREIVAAVRVDRADADIGVEVFSSALASLAPADAAIRAGDATRRALG